MQPHSDRGSSKHTASRLGRATQNISAILSAVRNLSVVFLLVVGAAVLSLSARPAHRLQQDESQTAPQPAPPSAVAAPSGPVIVLDPAHGGTDTGARGQGGLAEKDIVLQIARTVREQLALQGYRVVLTRKDDSNPSYDDRAAVANVYHDAVFVSLHVASTGTPGTVRAYYDQFSATIPPDVYPTTAIRSPAAPTTSLIVWDQAQRGYIDVSRHFADVIQSQLARSFPGSPVQSTGAPVRALRSVMAPAVAIETSSISRSTRDALVGAAGLVSSAISSGVSAVRPPAAAGAK
jgi:N-acetylmuramoyl-L-alanine amidase